MSLLEGNVLCDMRIAESDETLSLANLDFHHQSQRVWGRAVVIQWV